MLVKLVLLIPAGSPSAEEIVSLLGEAGLEAQQRYMPLHFKLGLPSTALPFSESLRNRVVCVPLDHELKKAGSLRSRCLDVVRHLVPVTESTNVARPEPPEVVSPPGCVLVHIGLQ